MTDRRESHVYCRRGTSGDRRTILLPRISSSDSAPNFSWTMKMNPVLSLLLVAVLGWSMFGSYLAEEISSYILGIGETFLPLFFILLILLILLVIFMNDLLVIPLALFLGFFSLRIGPLGPLLLLLVILFFEKYLQSRRPLMIYRSA